MILKEGETFKLNAVISPDDASNKNVIWSSSNESIVSVDSTGTLNPLAEGTAVITVKTEDGGKEKFIEITVMKNLEGTEIIFDQSLKTIGNIITGLDYLNTSVQNLKSKIDTAFIVEIYNNKGELLDNTQNIGTGGKITFRNSENQVIAEYNVVLYGDANGDGKINSIDLLVIQRHILKLQTFNGLFLKASNISKNGKAPSSLDLLKIQRHILKLEIIGQ